MDISSTGVSDTETRENLMRAVAGFIGRCIKGTCTVTGALVLIVLVMMWLGSVLDMWRASQ